MKVFKPKFWGEKNSLISYFLLPFAFLLQFLIKLKKKNSKKETFTIPVICIGNIYLGGTGKTPLAIEVVKILKKLNNKTAVIKKLYKNHIDEFKLIESKNIILFKDRSRSTAIKKAIAAKFECVVLDDGFQDMSIHKDINIVCFNEKQLLGNGFTLPAGPLREPATSLKKCQIVVINGEKNHEFENIIKNISNTIDIYYSKYLPVNIEKFQNQNLLAFAGIGNPDNFFDLLEMNNLKLFKKIIFPDHYNYSLTELNDMISFSKKNNLKIVTTEKDFYRIKHFELPQIQSLNVKLEILNVDKFQNNIIRYL
tara:strand:- start:5505 stop:6434 length:930 start_codon:yes stop_codon:yes gene_type:complete